MMVLPLAPSASAQEETPAPPPAEAPAAEAPAAATPTVEERLADIEAYMNNVPRPEKASGAESLVAGPGPGHNAWQMVSTALVLFMTLPGLALFYGGLVRRKNVLSVLAQCLGCACMITPLWWLCGYSLAFGAGNAFIGDMSYAMFKGVEPNNVGAGFVWISDSMWAMFQLTFAIITPALIVGAIAERMKFISIMVFILIWMFAVYFPFAHMVWSTTGLMCGPLNGDAAIKAIDFAGGTVVHMTSGWSALVLCIILGKRHNVGKEPMSPHSMVLCMVGTGMLWVGWYGFNAGSALGADGIASNAFVTTTLCAGTAGLFWALAEWILKGKPSVLGFCSGIVAGLVVITPAAGFVTATSAVIMGVLAGVVCFVACAYLKKALGYDDALDTFGVHGIGGTMGAILTGVFASPAVHPVLGPKDAGGMDLMPGLLMNQLKAVGLTVVWSVVATAVIALIVKAILGLRPDIETETAGLDLADHGEAGYEH
ncbi:ammonium transporter [Luteolibacter sp. GHJ8]|uniref:Ammonium transporter n=1 Tax=Luteolibacter rhizosphaerae TaxID=2989719 RepID=A0ABT3G7C1_9BACT|nr:ammonium transporter [Luteolibacter rhizosphaerae]MCW1915753.1 ammonium transporter [Luteolibacter rhizosphaerae]